MREPENIDRRELDFDFLKNQTDCFMTRFVTLLIVLAGLILVPLASAQMTVTGTVTSAESGEPLPGVSVNVQGTLSGTTTGIDGMYSLAVPDAGSTLVFRFVGFRSQQIAVTEGMTTLDVTMEVSVLDIEEVVVVGSRRLPRLVKDSAVPVDVFGPRDLATQSSTDLDDILRTQVPSYNVQRHGIDDEATLVRPITLRGLPSDNVIVLINGKRRHRSGSMALLGTSLNVGSQGSDLNMIPSIAIGRVEILRDGASAQYGADAVAGVFNMQLRNNSTGVHVRMQGGQYSEGDGRHGMVGVNVGLPLTQNGFANLSLEYRDADPTIRSGLRADEGVLLERGYPLSDPAQIWGAPDVSNSVVGFLNAGIDVGSAHVYAFGGYGQREAEGGFYFRAPGTGSARSAVFRFGSGASATRAVADLNESDDIVCSEVVPSLDADFATVSNFVGQYQGRCFVFNELFPGGFTPRFGANIYDLSGTFGVRGGSDDGLRWDASVIYGNSQVDYFIYNTVNASLGPNTPTSFKPRGYRQRELTAAVTMSLPVEVEAFAEPLNVAVGLEWRQEEFETVAGDPESYEAGPFSAQGFSVGSNGYQGLNPKFANVWTRPNMAAYVDLETDVTERWVVGVAGRYENYYDDFGSTITGKVAALYRATDRIRLRGTVSTGFRAPTPGQANLWALQTALSGTGDQLVETGQLPSTHPISAALGGKPLTEETARSFTLGTVMDISENLTLTVDYFDIRLEDRISLTGNIAISQEISDIMDEANLLGGVENLAEVKFFSNDFTTRTQGYDLLLAYDVEHDNGNATIASMAWNYTRTSLVDHSAPSQISEFLGQNLQTPFNLSVLTPRRIVEIEQLNPRHRVVVSGRHMRGAVHGMLRLSYYDGWFVCRNNSNSCTDGSGPLALLDEFEGQVIADLEVGYTFANNYRVAFGIDNLLDTVPDTHADETLSQGNIRPESTPWDYNGRAVVLRFTADLF